MSLATIISAAKEWQDLLAGILGFGGAVGAIWYAALSDRRKYRDESKALRLALGIELRDIAANVLRVYHQLNAVPGITIENFSPLVRFVEPTVYKRTADNIARVGEHASAIVYFHSQVEYCAEGAQRLRSTITLGYEVPEPQRRETISALGNALRAALDVIPTLEPINAKVAAADIKFRQDAQKALTTWGSA